MAISLQSCHDKGEDLLKEMEKPEISDLPEGMSEGFTISFRMTLEPMGGDDVSLTRATSSSNDVMREIESYIDLEKVRILFFACLDNDDQIKENGKVKYETGKHDVFLFESKSRWVSKLTGSKYADWQVTAPVYTYGNNDEYNWELIREILTTCDFKVALLVNRPNEVNFGDFDGKFGKDIVFYTDRGPAWGPDYSVARITDENGKGNLRELYDYAKSHNFRGFNDTEWNNLLTRFKGEGFEVPTINGLHHCQWDPIYSSKNNTTNIYDFIMGNPQQSLSVPSGVGDFNMMGALSFWTQKKYDANGKVITDPTNKDKDATFFFLPDRQHPIPMYGVQRFPAIPNVWRPGTPFNISDYMEGVAGSDDFENATISLLRSLVRIDFIVPTSVAKEITNVRLRYANVMARCEPLDVATPTNLIWADEHGTYDNRECEWWNIYDAGPIINSEFTGTGGRVEFLKRMAWYYGAWKDWWDFKGKNSPWTSTQKGGESSWDDSYLTIRGKGKPHPRIFNPVIQRNQEGQLVDCEIYDPGNHHFVVYCGERNINDPTKFETLTFGASEFAYIYFEVKNGNNTTPYCFPLTDYSNSNHVIYGINDVDNSSDKQLWLSSRGDLSKYRSRMGGASNYYDWNYPLLRNHNYIFQVDAIGNNESDGLNSLVISSERRTAPTIEYH